VPRSNKKAAKTSTKGGQLGLFFLSFLIFTHGLVKITQPIEERSQYGGKQRKKDEDYQGNAMEHSDVGFFPGWLPNAARSLR
jgi:hypothetical protein